MQCNGVPSIYPPQEHSRNWLHGVERHCRSQPRKAWPRGSHHKKYIYKYHNVVITNNIYIRIQSVHQFLILTSPASKRLGHAFASLRIKQLTTGDRCSCIPAPNDFTSRQVSCGRGSWKRWNEPQNKKQQNWIETLFPRVVAPWNSIEMWKIRPKAAAKPIKSHIRIIRYPRNSRNGLLCLPKRRDFRYSVLHGNGEWDGFSQRPRCLVSGPV